MREAIQIVPQEERVRQIFKDRGVYLAGDHFQYSSGKHGSEYLNKDAIFSDSDTTSEVCRFLVRPFQARNIDVIAGMPTGGLILAHDAARELSRLDNRLIPGVFPEEKEGMLKFFRGYDKFIRGKNVLAVEDILNTGDSVKKLVDVIRETGGNVIALAAIANRGGVKPETIGDVPIYSLLDVNMESWSPEDCRLCENGIPLNQNVGHAPK